MCGNLLILDNKPAFNCLLVVIAKGDLHFMRADMKALLAAFMTLQLVFDHDKVTWKQMGYF